MCYNINYIIFRKENSKLNKAIGTGSIDRSARVRRIKRVLILLFAMLIVLPTVLCICLFAKINKLEKQIYDLSLIKETHTVITENTTVVEAKESEPVIPVAEAVTLVKENIENDSLKEDNESKETKKSEKDSKDDLSESDLDEAFDSEKQTKSNTESKKDIKLKRVYLTFDDGPSCHTARILDILKQYDVKATFFVNGKEQDSLKPLYKRIVDEGHQIGMHSYTHVYHDIYANTDAFTYDLNRIQAYIYEQTGVLSDIYRFPGGSSNTVSRISMSEFANILDNRGIKYYDWNVLSGDASSTYGLPCDVIANNVINGALNQEDAIILMHDLPEKTTSVEALPRILEYFKNLDVEIIPIDENTIEMHQPFAK